MLWEILLEALCGAIAGALSLLLVRDAKNHRGTQAATFVVAIVLLNGLARPYVLPRLRAFDAPRGAHNAFRQNHLLSLVATRHPEIEGQFVEMIVDAVKSGASPAEAKARGVAWGAQIVGPLASKYLPSSSDAALVAFTQATVDVFGALEKQGDDSCYQRMFPASGKTALPAPKLDPVQEKKMVDAMAMVFESAFSSPTKPDPPAESAAAMRWLLEELARKRGEKYIDELSNLSAPKPAREDRLRACSAILVMYGEALDATPGRRARVLRAMYAQK